MSKWFTVTAVALLLWRTYHIRVHFTNQYSHLLYLCPLLSYNHAMKQLRKIIGYFSEVTCACRSPFFPPHSHICFFVRIDLSKNGPRYTFLFHRMSHGFNVLPQQKKDLFFSTQNLFICPIIIE